MVTKKASPSSSSSLASPAILRGDLRKKRLVEKEDSARRGRDPEEIRRTEKKKERKKERTASFVPFSDTRLLFLMHVVGKRFCMRMQTKESPTQRERQPNEETPMRGDTRQTTRTTRSRRKE